MSQKRICPKRLKSAVLLKNCKNLSEMLLFWQYAILFGQIHLKLCLISNCMAQVNLIFILCIPNLLCRGLPFYGTHGIYCMVVCTIDSEYY